MILCKISNCITKLTNGTSDVSIGETPHYFLPKDQSVVPLQPMSQDGFYIISPYNCSIEKAIEDSTVSDFMETLNSYSWSVWIVTLLAFFSLSSLISIRSRIHRQRRSSGLWTVTTYILLNPYFKPIRGTVKLLSFLVALYTFLFVILHTKNIIKTEQVRIREQEVYRSYRDIINAINNDENITIMYSSMTNLLNELANEPQNDVRKRMKHILSGHNGRMEKRFLNFIPFLSGGKSNNLVIEKKLYSQSLKYYACRSATFNSYPKRPDVCLHRTPEMEYSHQVMAGIISSSSFLSKSIHHSFKLR